MKKLFLLSLLFVLSVSCCAQANSRYRIPEIINNNQGLSAVLDSVITWNYTCMSYEEHDSFEVHVTPDTIDGHSFVTMRFSKTGWANSEYDDYAGLLNVNGSWFIWFDDPHIPSVDFVESTGTDEFTLDNRLIIDFPPTIWVVYYDGQFIIDGTTYPCSDAFSKDFPIIINGGN